MPNVVYRKRLEPCHQSCQRLSDSYLVNENVKGRGCGWKGDEPGGIKTSNPRCTLVRLGSTLVDGTWSAKAGSRLRRSQRKPLGTASGAGRQAVDEITALKAEQEVREMRHQHLVVRAGKLLLELFLEELLIEVCTRRIIVVFLGPKGRHCFAQHVLEELVLFERFGAAQTFVRVLPQETLDERLHVIIHGTWVLRIAALDRVLDRLLLLLLRFGLLPRLLLLGPLILLRPRLLLRFILGLLLLLLRLPLVCLLGPGRCERCIAAEPYCVLHVFFL